MSITKEIKLNFKIQEGEGSNWQVECKQTSMLIGCETRKQAKFLKDNWSSWEFVDVFSDRGLLDLGITRNDVVKFIVKPHGKNYTEEVVIDYKTYDFI